MKVGIEIPFPQQDLRVKEVPEGLLGAGPAVNAEAAGDDAGRGAGG